MTATPDWSFQERAIQRALEHKEGRLGISSPTGTGKTYMQSRVLKATNFRTLQTVPTLEIGYGFSKALGIPKTREALESHGIYTVKRLVNLLADCKIDLDKFDSIQMDEGHHGVDDTHRQVDAFLGRRPARLWSATFFRGTAKGTQELHEFVNHNIFHAITISEAVKCNVMTLPTVEVWPLVDDELIDVTNGEFQVTKIDGLTRQILDEAARCIVERYWRSNQWDRPTMIAVSSVATAQRLTQLLLDHGTDASCVTGLTPDDERQAIFTRLASGQTILVQVNVVTEGVDIPEIARLIDLDPTMSPVKCMQRVGRICRWKPIPGEWVVCNHNLLRHGYLWEGGFPPSAFIKAKTAWSPDFKPSKRLAMRAIRGDLKGLGRFEPASVPVLDGSPCWLYCFGLTDGFKASQYAILLHPAVADPIVATREIPIGEDGKKDYSKKPRWKRIKAVPEIKGAVSLPSSPLTPGQDGWWRNSAKRFNLDPNATLNARAFQVLPILADLNLRAPLCRQ